ncbi:MAG: molecular chaperone DnaJ [Candidatus Symbiobacter sp.]|nr:molecular chaperone DnaJ [Candidatus Symbiobacter sp.]
MSNKKDFYDVLEVGRNASADDLKRAYRKLAMQYHPDRNPGDATAEQRFKEINEAYDVLKDEQKRAAYDRFGMSAFENGGPGGGARGGQAGGFEFHFGQDFSDIFGEMFGEFMGGKRGGGGGARGSDLRFDLELTLGEAFAGKKTQIELVNPVSCTTCDGQGTAPGTKPRTCPTCQGQGKVRSQQGFFTVERTCLACQGMGRVIETPCPECRGAGRVRKERILTVEVPPGVEDGTRIRMAGEGEAGLGGAPAGDLYIFLAIKPDKIFGRDGANLLCRAPIPMTTAALGGSIEVPSIDGTRARVAIPAGTQTGSQFRVRGKGMSVLNSSQRGDLFIEITVETPVNLSPQQIELLQNFAAATGHGTSSPEHDGFLAKVKEFWSKHVPGGD